MICKNYRCHLLWSSMVPQERKNQANANHKANLAYSMRRRLEAARAKNNNELLSILEREMQELGLSL